MKLFRNISAAVLVAVGTIACDSSTLTLGTDDADASATGDIVQTAVAAGSFNTLAAALGATGLDAVLADDSREFTVFAPTDDAFAELGQETINALLSDPDTLTDILLYHVIADSDVDSVTAVSLAGSAVQAANLDDLQLSLDDAGDLFINNAKVTTADVLATNGRIHVINKVLLPPAESEQPETGSEEGGNEGNETAGNIIDTALAAGSFNTLAAALEATGLIPVLADENSTFTVFAPTDDAFAALGQETIDALLADPDTLKDILLYHVIAGQAVNAETALGLAGNSVEMANGDEAALSLDKGGLFINQAKVTATDIAASNGIIHVIDAVILPPADEMAEPQLNNIYDTAINAGNFTTLVTALQVAGLDSALADNTETYTVFAPTDDAFAALGQHTIDALIAHPDVLTNVLLYHVIAGSAVGSEAAISLAGSTVSMANGDQVSISLKGNELYINDAAVTVTDIMASNGIIHVIDTVLIPH